MLPMEKQDGRQDIQGHSQHPSENNGLLLTKYESERLPEPTGGSPDVVHLLKYAFEVIWCPFEGARGCPLKK